MDRFATFFEANTIIIIDNVYCIPTFRINRYKRLYHLNRIKKSAVNQDYKGVIYFNLLPGNRMFNLDVYCLVECLMKMEETIKEKRQ